MKKCSVLILIFVLYLCASADGAVDTLRPGVCKESFDWSNINCSGATHTCVNDDDNTSYMQTIVSNPADAVFICTTFASSYSSIDSVVIQCRAQEYNILGTQKLIMGRGGQDLVPYALCPGDGDIAACDCDDCPQDVDTTAQLIDSGSGWEEYRFSFTCDPCDNASWEASDLNDTDRGWGFDKIGQQVRVAEVWVFVYYQEAAAGQVIIVH